MAAFKTSGGNAAFKNFNNQFAHVTVILLVLLQGGEIETTNVIVPRILMNVAVSRLQRLIKLLSDGTTSVLL
jgi:hypothetical protein